MELAQYLNVAYFSPVKSIFVTGIKNNQFTSWPVLTPSIINKYLPTSVAKLQGYIYIKSDKFS